MYARAVWFDSRADQLDARIADFPRRMQSIKETPGCMGIAALANRETGAGISVTYWDTPESMRASETASATIRTQIVAEGGIQVREVDRFESLFEDRVVPPAAGAFVRLVDSIVPIENIDAIADAIRAGLPDARGLSGFRALMGSVNRTTGRMLVAASWNSAVDREAAAAHADRVGERLRPLTGGGTSKVDAYEVVYSEVKSATRV
jgi:heme-degrading monooxygenase HmoA